MAGQISEKTRDFLLMIHNRIRDGFKGEINIKCPPGAISEVHFTDVVTGKDLDGLSKARNKRVDKT